MAETLALRQTYSHRLMGGGGAIEQKDIYGPGWRAFQGITDSGAGVDEIQDNPAGYSRARLVESYIFRAQDVRGSAIDSVPLRVWTTDERGRKSATPHPALDVLTQNCPADPAFDPYVTGSSSLMRYTLLSLDGHGRSGWKLAFNGKGMPTEIYYLPPQGFKPLHGFEVRQNVPFGGLQYTASNQYDVLKPQEVVYFQTDNPDDPLLGTSKVSILRGAINLRMYSVRSNRDFFRNSMRPDWILTGEWPNNEETTERIKRALRRHYTGEANREPLVLGGKSEAHLLTTSQKDAEWQAMMRIVQEEISAIYGVPVVYLNNMERATYQNIETAKLMLWHDTMMPETKKLAAMLTQRFLYRFWPDARSKGLEFGFDYNTVTGLNEDVARIWERFNALIDRVSKQVETRQLTPNQARQQMANMAEALGLDPTPWKGDLPDGNIFYLPYNQVPSTQANVQAAMNIEAARSSNPNAIDLVENVEGAEHARDNAQAGIQRLTALQREQIQAQSRASAASSSNSSSAQKTFEPRVVVKTPNPIPIRDARLAPIEKRLVARIKVFFQGQQTEILRGLRKGKALQKADAFDPDLLYDRELAKAEIRAIIRDGASESAQAAFQAASDDFGLGVVWQDGTPWLEEYVGGRINLIDGIDDTTAEDLRQTLLAGSQQGDTIPQLADRVSEVFSSAIEHRSLTIARTETVQAYGNASLRAYHEAGIEKARMYDGPNADSADCINVDGQIVSLAEAQSLMSQEHPNGTRGVAPVVDVPGFAQEAATFVFNANGVLVA